MVFSFRFWWLCNSKHTEGVPMAQLFATEIYTTIWTLPGLLVCVAYSHPRLFSVIHNTDSHRDYSTNKMDSTPMSAHGNLAGYRNLFLHWPANLYFCLVRWVALKVEKGLIFSEAAHA